MFNLRTIKDSIIRLFPSTSSGDEVAIEDQVLPFGTYALESFADFLQDYAAELLRVSSGIAILRGWKFIVQEDLKSAAKLIKDNNVVQLVPEVCD